MGSKILTSDIARAIRLEIQTCTRSYCKLSFKDFTEILFKNDLCSDIRTVKQKWDIFASKNIICPNGKDPYTGGILDLINFNDEWPDYAISIKPADDAHTHTHTQTETGAGVIQ